MECVLILDEVSHMAMRQFIGFAIVGVAVAYGAGASDLAAGASRTGLTSIFEGSKETVSLQGVGGVIPLDQVQASQSGSVTQTVATTEITVTYDRPVARGRELFGGIVAYGEIWNPGANDATKIEISHPITINGESLDAGAYSVWAIPDPEEWAVIFSSAADVYHTPYPGEEHDALRLVVSPASGDHMETLAFYFPAVEKKDTVLRLHWGETVIAFDITVP
jgi:hypothetical protein